MKVAPAAIPPSASTGRSSSYRRYAVVVSMGFAAALAAVVTVGAVGGVLWSQPGPQVSEPEPLVAVAAKKAKGAADTASLPGNSRPKQYRAAPKPKPKPAPARSSGSVGAGPFVVKLAQGATSVEVKCGGGYRQRAAFAGGVATVPDLPVGEDCTVIFKGGPPAQFRPVRAHMTVECSLQGTTAVCEQDGP